MGLLESSSMNDERTESEGMRLRLMLELFDTFGSRARQDLEYLQVLAYSCDCGLQRLENTISGEKEDGRVNALHIVH